MNQIETNIEPFPRLSGYDIDQIFHLDHFESSNWHVLCEPENLVIIAN